MTLAELLDVIYRYYPRRIYADSPGYDDTPEQRRLMKAVQRAVSEYPEWKAMMRRLAACTIRRDFRLARSCRRCAPANTRPL